MVGANRVIPGIGICNPLGDANLSPEDEKVLRRQLVEQALEALQTEVK
jgi:betaine reductase